MTENSLYDKIIEAKTGVLIPAFKSGRTVESRYDPVRDAERIADGINENTRFIILLGIAGGTLINCILQKRNDIFILAVEKSSEDIDFLLQIDCVKELSKKKNICFCTLDKLQEKITELYIPSFFGNLEVIEQRGWTTENTALLQSINQNISNALSIVSADFSVQSHFGKLWQHNILSNLFYCISACDIKDNFSQDKRISAVFAAGPSLDSSLEIIKSNRTGYFVIATDTGFSVLLSNKIIPDAVISIDGQYVSCSHFIQSKSFDFSNTEFLFDLSANSSAVKKLVKQGAKVSFFKSGHPFSEYADSYLGLNLPYLYSGSGTVTIAAVDYAIKCGFKEINVFGADFAYINGKPYAKGTYLDKLYNSAASRYEASEQKFCALQFRTELQALGNKRYTTSILDGYRKSFEEFILKYGNGVSLKKEGDIYVINIAGCRADIHGNRHCETEQSEGEAIHNFIKTFSFDKSPAHFSTITDFSQKDISLLPLISWIRTHDNNNKADFNYYYTKAVNYFDKWLKRIK